MYVNNHEITVIIRSLFFLFFFHEEYVGAEGYLRNGRYLRRPWFPDSQPGLVLVYGPDLRSKPEVKGPKEERRGRENHYNPSERRMGGVLSEDRTHTSTHSHAHTYIHPKRERTRYSWPGSVPFSSVAVIASDSSWRQGPPPPFT